MMSDEEFSKKPLFGLLRPVNKSLALVVFQKGITDTELLFNRILFDLNDNELNMNNGRFKNFTQLERYPYKTTTPVRYFKNGWMYIDIKNITERMNWIAESVNNSWSIQVLSYIKHRNLFIDCAFSFKNKIEAGHFALRWR